MLQCTALKKCSRVKKRRKVEKLHRKFAHASKKTWISLVRGSKTFNDKEFLDLIQDVCDSCSVCLVFRKPSLQPVVGLTLGNRFNDSVCQDLKEYGHNKYWILHLIDTFTRYSAAKLIKTKRREKIIHNIFLMWTSYFEPPRCLFSDNGENLTMKNTDRWMKNWILKHALQLRKVHSAIVLWNATIS